ncbi:MAG: stage II sporulation protein P [Clostridia bacterium]|nr:stage II sporulation protein P [Clostridia bacterium]
MRRYRAVVIDAKKVLRHIVAMGIVAAVVATGILNINIADVEISMDKDGFAEQIINESLPAIGATGGTDIFEKTKAFFKKATSFVLTFDPFDPRTVIFGHIPLVRQVSAGYLASSANTEVAQVFNPKDADQGKGEADAPGPNAGVYPITEVDSGQAKALGKSKNKILIRNETEFGINIDEMLKSPLSFNMNGDGPKILIVHTHATESYSPDGASTYSADKGDRSEDSAKNMIAVGDAMSGVFKNYGIDVIHDKTLHDKPSFNTSYANSLKTVNQYLAKYPSIRIVLDIHRDAFVYENGSKAKFVTEINGQKTAQLMLVVGTNAGGLDHPNWRENMKLALKLQNAIIDEYPNLMRGVNLRKERFNGHATPGSMIIEVGSSGNTLAEAIRGATYGAEEVAKFLNEIK